MESENPTSATASSSSSYEHHEDRLFRSWRTVAHYVVLATNKAEKAASIGNVLSPTDDSNQQLQQQQTTISSNEEKKTAVREVEKVVVEFLRARVEWGRLISTLEAKLQGKAEEMENLQQYVRCQPALGMSRKRKRIASTTEK